jgi:hypothetical protein
MWIRKKLAQFSTGSAQSLKENAVITLDYNYTETSHSREANSLSPAQEIPNISTSQEVKHYIHNSSHPINPYPKPHESSLHILSHPMTVGSILKCYIYLHLDFLNSVIATIIT